MVEISYGKAKLQSKVSINLSLTRNKQILGEQLQIFLKDVSDKIMMNSNNTIYDEQPIVIQAFAINNRGEMKNEQENDLEGDKKEQSLQKTLIDTAWVSTGVLRQVHNADIKLHVPIRINHFFSGGDVAEEEQPDKEDEEDSEDEAVKGMANELLRQMNQDLKAMKASGEDKNDFKKYLLIQMTVKSSSTRIVKNPMGILTLGELGLINLDKIAYI